MQQPSSLRDSRQPRESLGRAILEDESINIHSKSMILGVLETAWRLGHYDRYEGERLDWLLVLLRTHDEAQAEIAAKGGYRWLREERERLDEYIRQDLVRAIEVRR